MLSSPIQEIKNSSFKMKHLFCLLDCLKVWSSFTQLRPESRLFLRLSFFYHGVAGWFRLSPTCQFWLHPINLLYFWFSLEWISFRSNLQPLFLKRFCFNYSSKWFFYFLKLDLFLWFTLVHGLTIFPGKGNPKAPIFKALRNRNVFILLLHLTGSFSELWVKTYACFSVLYATPLVLVLTSETRRFHKHTLISDSLSLTVLALHGL